MKKFSKIATFALTVLLILLTLITVINNKYLVIHVNGNSMYPTLKDNTVVLFEKGPLEVGSIVLFSRPDDWLNSQDYTYIKRVKGLAGDFIQIHDNSISINGDFVSIISCNIEVEFMVQENEVFVMGDNQSNSNDSIYQLCAGNENFLIYESDIIAVGHIAFQ